MKIKSNDKIPKAELRLAEEIARNAHEFQSATPEQRRVMVAKDVIAQVRAGQLKPTPGDYVATHEYDYEQDAEIALPVCEVCAIGGVFMSSFIDRSSLRQSLDSTCSAEMVDLLGKQAGFSEHQLRMMEAAFEGIPITGKDISQEEEHRCKHFYQSVRGSDSDRLIAIMQNVVDNGGMFVP